tara:strand:- start:138 stop:305 length:168 start_codon:yes stop_codon:yes gene_type:complete
MGNIINSSELVFIRKKHKDKKIGLAHGVFAVDYLGHQKYINKEYFLNYIKTYLNI